MRMVQAPIGLLPQSFEEVSGPRTIGQPQTNQQFIQNTIDPFGLWAFRVDYPPLKGGMARAFEKWRTSLMAGGNCTRMTLRSAHEPTHQELGLNVSSMQDVLQNWSNGLPWSNGQPWNAGKPHCQVAAAADKDASVITLNLSKWNGVVPAWFGIVNHFAAYKVIGEDINGDIARLKVWPPIRKAIKATDYATLRPVVCVTLATADSASGSSQVGIYRGASLTVREVPQDEVDRSVAEGF